MATPIQLGPTHFTLTLNGSAQQLSSVLAAALAANQGLDLEPQVCVLTLQPDGGNGAAVYVGYSSAVSSSDYGFSLPAASGGVPPTPFTLAPLNGRQLYLSDLWVIGTNAQKLHLGLIPARV